VANAPEPPEELRHAVDILGTVAALHEAFTNQSHVGPRALQLKPRLFVACGDGDF
jgi:hypothetical protein